MREGRGSKSESGSRSRSGSLDSSESRSPGIFKGLQGDEKHRLKRGQASAQSIPSQIIICDARLKELFQLDSFHGFSVAKLLTAHIMKRKGKFVPRLRTHRDTPDAVFTVKLLVEAIEMFEYDACDEFLRSLAIRAVWLLEQCKGQRQLYWGGLVRPCSHELQYMEVYQKEAPLHVLHKFV
ncbi:hypothetical protein KSP40_PGU005067 [Platanthera guangdongensis]|uniref:Uncharacterized protein n=1 Tax=Platanthera guangdongensis TaxID=2320717 RepID=A0ABR2MJY8_9ASPA